MKTIQLTRGQVALVSGEDYDELSKHKWCAKLDKGMNTYYAVRCTPRDPETGKQKTLQMHRVIIGLEIGDRRQVDHINHITLDNQRENLRVVSGRANRANLKGKGNGKYTSKYVGVCWYKHLGRWVASIRTKNKSKYLGSFDDEELAHQAYQKALMETEETGYSLETPPPL